MKTAFRAGAAPVLTAAALLMLAACGGSAGTPAAPHAPSMTLTSPAPSKVLHVVIIVQENRSMDFLFSGSGIPGLRVATSGLASNGTSVPLQEEPLAAGIICSTCNGGAPQPGVDLNHTHLGGFETEYDGGKMDGFDKEPNCQMPCRDSSSNQEIGTDYAYGRAIPSEVAPYWEMARQYAIADDYFTDQAGESFPAHQYLIAGAASTPDGPVDGNPSAIPWGCDAPAGTTTPVLQSGHDVTGPFPCFNYMTIGDLLDAKGISWRYYAPKVTIPVTNVGEIWSAYDAIDHIRYGPDWSADVVSDSPQILTDIANGNLATVSWVVPDFLNSDHPRANSNTGPSWVASIVNAIGNSPYWSNTVIFITWDDWGGFYDHVPPPQLDAMGLGFRTPLIVVSPFAKHGYVSHEQHEMASMLRYIEERWNLGNLGTADVRADDLHDMFDYGQAIKPFSTIAAPYTVQQVLAAAKNSDGRVPDTDW